MFLFIECVGGFYNRTCTGVCGHCVNGEACLPATGYCAHGCSNNFRHPLCQGKTFIINYRHTNLHVHYSTVEQRLNSPK